MPTYEYQGKPFYIEPDKSKHNEYPSIYKDQHELGLREYYVYIIRSVKTNEMLMGARANNSPYFTQESSARKKCKELNKKLKQYSSTTKEDLYKVTKCRLVGMIDYYDDLLDEDTYSASYQYNYE